MRDEVSQVVAALKHAKHFDEAAVQVLERVLRAAGEALAASSFATSGRILRGTVQLRPDHAFRRLVVVAADAANGASGREAPALAPVDASTFVTSATAWRTVVEHGCPVSIDVNTGAFQLHGGSSATSQRGLAPEMFGNESRREFLERETSHVHVLPLYSPGGGVAGMVSIEAKCAEAVGRNFVWPQVVERLQLLADVAAPHLSCLPQRPGPAAKGDPFLPVVGSVMAEQVPMLRLFAQQGETMLLGGPTGAGKSRLARWCHEHSRRRSQPFETLKLVTVPEEQQLAELFGWKQVALGEVVGDNPGALARAQGGTLFIDEVEKLSLKAQAALLQVMEQRSYRMVGESTERRADVRFVLGTSADLRAAVKSGQFREDLYYRITVLPVRVPSLEERRDEIVPWARHMLEACHRENVPSGQARLSPEAERLLAGESWPGNLRQLESIIRRAYLLQMVECGGVASEVLVEERHLSGAFAYEGAPAQKGLVELLLRAAMGFVREAQVRRLDLDLADAFRGFVLGSAILQLGRDEAFILLGKETLVRNRNHHKSLRREMEKVDGLLRAIGESKSPFAGILGPDPDEGS